MDKVCEVVLFGCGNITNLRHLPAVRSLGKGFRIFGLVGLNPESISRTAEKSRKLGLSGKALKTHMSDQSKEEIPEWVYGADLVLVGTPPDNHASLLLDLSHAGTIGGVLVEKPLLVSIDDRARLKDFASARTVSAVMHNFQFADGFLRAKRAIEEGRVGEVSSIQAYQWSTKDRRLPTWYKSLPAGLFWDEASHFFYLLEALVGELSLTSAHGFASRVPGDPTPSVLTATYISGSGVPVNLAMHFEAGISEWGLVISGSQGTIIYDMFRDICISLPFDGPHLAREVLRTSIVASGSHWGQIVQNGIKLYRGRLHYGVNSVLRKLADTVEGAELDPAISVAAGLRVTDYMREIVGNLELTPDDGRLV